MCPDCGKPIVGEAVYDDTYKSCFECYIKRHVCKMCGGDRGYKHHEYCFDCLMMLVKRCLLCTDWAVWQVEIKGLFKQYMCDKHMSILSDAIKDTHWYGREEIIHP